MKRIVVSNESQVVILLDKPGMEIEVVGAFYAKGNEKKEIQVTVIHSAKHTSSNIILKGVGQDNSSLSIVGTIIVKETALGTQSFLKERILLLSKNATAHATPNLEIFTDNVKCSHAATISSIPEEQLFYLQSRGLTRKEAMQIITKGFLTV